MTAKKSLTVPAMQFMAHCLELVERVRRTGLQITITKHGKPVARMIGADDEPRPLFGSLPVKILGDIVEPIDEVWEAERRSFSTRMRRSGTPAE